ncbi:hypothetical protein OH76DRAFT_1351581 [Lentinus brumalis]|uniref:Integrase core domain-containing protein n=1 Tax=Lentinus brumalis TaxID=2498619 RepID=A0A371D8R0_9APHY|nr:hypothetical protein OH76DRAFT_1351581 [Polyporus brumalis]
MHCLTVCCSSTRNVRIERMWLEVGTQFAIYWRAFFTRLERRHRLDPENSRHLWLLHLLFLDEINKSCASFQKEWNRHPISGAAHNQTPADMRFLSDLTQGVLPGNDLNNVDPDLLTAHYGTEGPPRLRRSGQTGAGHYDEDPTEETVPSSSSESDQSAASESDSQLAQDQARHVRHPPIPVPDGNCPFSDEELEIFLESLLEVRSQGFIPAGYGVGDNEWEDEDYGDIETLRRGRGGREDPVTLPFSIWWPRAVEWVQGLELMSQMLIDTENDDT